MSLLPPSALEAWAELQGIVGLGDCVGVEEIPGRGLGLVARRDLSRPTQESDGGPVLLRIPRRLVLAAARVWEYCSVDRKLGELRQEMVSRVKMSPRMEMMIFLFSQLQARRARDLSPPEPVFVTTAWATYMDFLPTSPPLPTLWSESERQLLVGTSIEAALESKLGALEAELGQLQASGLEVSAQVADETTKISSLDWRKLDAWFRSRSLDVPGFWGGCLVPVLDMINHAEPGVANAYYEISDDNYEGEGSVVVRLAPGASVGRGEEVTICYGDEKTGGEMLFAYGFIGADDRTAALRTTIPLFPLPDDPLAKCKMATFQGPPTVEVTAREETSTATAGKGMGLPGGVSWSSPLVHYLVLNSEDGLDFLPRSTTGYDGDGDDEGALAVFWCGEDVTERTTQFETLVMGHPIGPVLRLRALVLVECMARERLAGLQADLGDQISSSGRTESIIYADRLRRIDAGLLQGLVLVLEDEKTHMLQDPSIAEYIKSVATDNKDTELLKTPAMADYMRAGAEHKDTRSIPEDGSIQEREIDEVNPGNGLDGLESDDEFS